MVLAMVRVSSNSPLWKSPPRHIQRAASLMLEVFLHPISGQSKLTITNFKHAGGINWTQQSLVLPLLGFLCEPQKEVKGLVCLLGSPTSFHIPQLSPIVFHCYYNKSIFLLPKVWGHLVPVPLWHLIYDISSRDCCLFYLLGSSHVILPHLDFVIFVTILP